MAMSTTALETRTPPAVVVTDVPPRLDRLPWGRFHTLVVVALGITWVYSRRDAGYNIQANQHQSIGTFGVAYTYLFDPHFGVVQWGEHR